MTWDEYNIALKVQRKLGKRILHMGPATVDGSGTAVIVKYTSGEGDKEEVKCQVYKLDTEGKLVKVGL